MGTFKAVASLKTGQVLCPSPYLAALVLTCLSIQRHSHHTDRHTSCYLWEILLVASTAAPGLPRQAFASKAPSPRLASVKKLL